MPQSCSVTFFDENLDRNELNSVHVSQIIQANFCWVKIANYQLHHSHTPSPIAATMPFPKTNFSMINPNIVNSQHSPLWMNMNDVIMKYTHQQKETQNLTKKLQIITHLSALQSARNIRTHNTNSSITDQPVHPYSQRLIRSWVAPCTLPTSQKACSGSIHNVTVLA